MTCPTLDLSALQADRDREIHNGRAIVAARIGDLADKVLAWAAVRSVPGSASPSTMPRRRSA